MKQDLDRQGMFYLVDEDGWTSVKLYRTLRDALNDADLFFNDEHWRCTDVFRVYEIDEDTDSVFQILSKFRDGRIIE